MKTEKKPNQVLDPDPKAEESRYIPSSMGQDSLTPMERTILGILCSSRPRALKGSEIADLLPSSLKSGAPNKVYHHLLKLRAQQYISNLKDGRSNSFFEITDRGVSALFPPVTNEDIAKQIATHLSVRTGKPQDQIYRVLLRAIDKALEGERENARVSR